MEAKYRAQRIQGVKRTERKMTVLGKGSMSGTCLAETPTGTDTTDEEEEVAVTAEVVVAVGVKKGNGIETGIEAGAEQGAELGAETRILENLSIILNGLNSLLKATRLAPQCLSLDQHIILYQL